MMRIQSFIISYTFIFFLCFSVGYAQKGGEADGIRKQLLQHKANDTTRVLLLLEYGRTFYPAILDSFMAYNKRAVELSEKIEFPYGMIRGTNGIAMAKWRQGDLAGAKRDFFKALRLADTYRNVEMQVMVGDNIGVFYHSFGALDSAEYYYLRALEAGKANEQVKHYSKLNTDLANNYASKSDYVRAIQHLMEAKRLNFAKGDTFNQIINCIALGNIYYGMKDFDRAIASYREGEEINRTYGREDFRIRLLQNIGLLFVEIKLNPDSARFYINKSMAAAKENQEEDSYLVSLINLGNLEIKLNNYDQALAFYLLAYKSPELENKRFERTAVLVNLGLVYQYLGELTKAEQFAREGLALAKQGGYLTFEKNGNDVLAQIAFLRKDYQTAYQYRMRVDTLGDSIWSETVKNSVAEATFQLQLHQADMEKSLLLTENAINAQTILNQRFLVAAVVVVLLLVVMLMLIAVRSNRRQKELNRVLDKKNTELEELNVTKDKFISIIAHDLRSPFNALLGYLTELDENYQDYDEKTKREIIHRLKKSSYGTFNLLVNLLEWTQSQQGKMKSDSRQFQFSEIAGEVLDVLSTRHLSKNQTMATDYDTTLQVNTDPQILKSILINLINNAIKFTPTGGTITLTANKMDVKLVITVKDTGIGIPAAEIGNLFRLDSRFNRKGTENEPGTGLGLVMVQEYVTILGGTIHVASQEGVGSSFTVTLPEQILH